MQLPIVIPGFTIQEINQSEQALLIQAQSVSSNGVCPSCQMTSSQIHSYHRRSPHDLPVSDRTVRLVLAVKRFRCLNTNCSRRTFVERMPDFVPVYGHRTCRLTDALCEIAFANGGEAGAQLADCLRMPISADTLLRIIRKFPISNEPTPSILGVDDFAFRRGQRYGTILVDLEKHCPVDLLSDRSAEVLAGWLRDHPGVERISRDRSAEYARGIAESGSHPTQIVDRWHLLRNLREALERTLTRRYSQIKDLPLTPAMKTLSVPILPKRIRTPVELAHRQAKRAERYDKYQQVLQFATEGMSFREIAQRMGMHRNTVQRFVRSTTFPEWGLHPNKSSILSPYLPYLQRRFMEGCNNSQQLWREIKEFGFKGTSRQVIRWVQQAKAGGPTRVPSLPPPKQLVWVLFKYRAQLKDKEPVFLEYVLQDPTIQLAYSLVQEFRKIVCERKSEQLDGWLVSAEKSLIMELRNLVKNMRQDYFAIRAACSEEWSNGQTEGQNTRLKLLKRQMYGRAKLDLLRQRVLYRSGL